MAGAFVFRSTASRSGLRRVEGLRETAATAPTLAALTPPLRVEVTSQATRPEMAIYINGLYTPNPARADITSHATRVELQ